MMARANFFPPWIFVDFPEIATFDDTAGADVLAIQRLILLILIVSEIAGKDTAPSTEVGC